MASPSTGKRTRAVGAFVAGVVFASATPPLDFVPGILIGLAIFAWSLRNGEHGFRRGWLFGFGANLVALRFVPAVIMSFTPLPAPAAWLALVLLAAGQGVVWGIGGAIARVTERRVPGMSRWLAFAIGCYLATFVPAIFPWTPCGGLAPWPILLQLADVIGERGVTFVLALGCALVVEALSSKERARLVFGGVAIAIFAFVVAFGAARMASIDALRAKAPRVRIALVQPSFEASDRWDPKRAAVMIDRLSVLTRVAEARGVDLVVWPESAYPYSLAHGTKRSPYGPRAVLQDGVKGPVLTGAYFTHGPHGGGTNSAILATTDGAISPSYDKRHLLWFGETVPLADVFPWLRQIFAKGTGLEPGTESIAFETGAIRAAVLNCYEDTLPIAGREAMETKPNLLVNITNDAWFAGSGEGELHLRLAVLRAIETRRDLVRAVNRGPTSFVDASGRVVARYSDLLPKTLPVEPALLDGPPTFYARFGDAPVLVLIAGAIAALARSALRKQSGRRSTKEATPEAVP